MVNLEIIKSLPILADLTSDQLNLISKKANFKSIKKKRRIYEAGSTIENIYFVHKGSIKLGSDVGRHKSLVKHIAYDADVFGENMFTASTRTEYAEAIKDSTVISVDVKTVQYLLGQNNSFANRFTEVIIERINNLEQRMKNFIFMKAHKRIANFLKQTALVRGIKIGIDEVLINHGMSHKDISYMTDTSRQTVTRVLADLKNTNLIHFSSRKPNKILIRQIASL